MAEERIQLSKKDRISVWWRSTFIQGSGTTNVCKMVAGHFQ